MIKHQILLPWSFVKEMSLAFSTVERTGDWAEDVEAYRKLAQMYMKHEMTELERANLHLDHLNPLTEVKIDALRG